MCIIYYDSAALRERADELERLNEQLLVEIETLNDQEAALAAMWEGPAKDAFRQAYHNDSIQMKNFYNAVRVYIQVLLILIEYYARTENMNCDLARSRNYGGCGC